MIMLALRELTIFRILPFEGSVLKSPCRCEFRSSILSRFPSLDTTVPHVFGPGWILPHVIPRFLVPRSPRPDFVACGNTCIFDARNLSLDL